MTSATVGRNEPCPCGSGRRYKHCHGGADPPVDASGVRLQQLAVEVVKRMLAQGKMAEAASVVENLLGFQTPDLPSLRILGATLAQHDRERSMRVWQRVLALAPGDAEAHFHLGNLARAAGDLAAARTHFESARAANPRHAGTVNNLGLTLLDAGDAEGAIACFREVLAGDPAQADALANLAIAEHRRGEFAAADALHERAFALRSDWPVELWVQRAIAAQRAGSPGRAVEYFAEAARRAPDNAVVQANLGSALVESQRFAESDAPLARALALDPGATYVKSLLAHARQQRCAWEGLDTLFAEIEAELAGAAATPPAPFPLLSMPLSPEALRRAARLWASRIALEPPPRPPARPRGSRRLRVGFVTTDLRDHPTMHLALEFLERLDRGRVETWAYALLPPDPGPVGRRAVAAFEHFADVTGESVAATAGRVRSDRIDVLVDLNGYTAHGRPDLFARRPAPVIVNFLGFPGTLGAAWYDAIVVDPFGARPDVARHYDEGCLVLPVASFPSDTTRAPAGPPPTRAALGLPDDAFAFCCFNSAYKVLPDVFAGWLRLLAQVPGSVLWLADASEEARANLGARAARAGVAAQRLVFAPRVPVREHLARIAAADLFVDTFPYGAHTTANDALLAGLPLVTRAGATLPSRIAASQLIAAGLPELVTWSAADSEALALSLARDRPRLAALRERLRAGRATCPLFDMARYARDFAAGLEEGYDRIAAEG